MARSNPRPSILSKHRQAIRADGMWLLGASVRQRPENRVQNLIETSSDIFGEKTQHQVAMFLKQNVLAPIAAVRVCVGKMLPAVQFNRHARRGAEQIYLHFPPTIKRDRQLRIQTEPAGCFGQCLQPAKKKCLGRASSPVDSFGIQIRWFCDVNKQICQRRGPGYCMLRVTSPPSSTPRVASWCRPTVDKYGSPSLCPRQ